MFNTGAEVVYIEVPCGAHKVHIPCNYTITNGSDSELPIPDWIINSTHRYTAFNKPDGFEIRDTSLVVTDTSQPGLDNTLFTCQVSILKESGSHPCIYNISNYRVIIKRCEGK